MLKNCRKIPLGNPWAESLRHIRSKLLDISLGNPRVIHDKKETEARLGSMPVGTTGGIPRGSSSGDEIPFETL